MSAIAVIIVAFALCPLAGAQQRDQPLEFGSVAGRVVDRAGKPAESVRVFALPLERPNVNGKVIFAVTGPDGRFLLNQVQFGPNMLCVEKEQDFYPDTRFAARELAKVSQRR